MSNSEKDTPKESPDEICSSSADTKQKNRVNVEAGDVHNKGNFAVALGNINQKVINKVSNIYNTYVVTANPRCHPVNVFVIFLLIPGLVVTLRAFQFLQPFELSYYNHLMRGREDPLKKVIPKKGDRLLDDRFLIVTIDDQDVFYQEERNENLKGSLSDETLLRFLEKAIELNPAAIGLGVIRDHSLPEGMASKFNALVNEAKNRGLPVFTTCVKLDEEQPNGSKGYAPPYSLADRIGYGNFYSDSFDSSESSNRLIRRFSLATFDDPNQKSEQLSINEPKPCDTSKSFSFLIAEHFLMNSEEINEKIKVEQPNYEKITESKCEITFKTISRSVENNFLQEKEISFPILEPNSGGYHGYSEEESKIFGGCQILLSYREFDIQDRYDKVSLRKFLGEDIDGEDINYKDRIILLGVDRGSVNNRYLTPHIPSNTVERATRSVPDVFLWANMISQVVDAALGRDTLIYILLSRKQDFILLLVVSFLGSSIGYILLRKPSLLFANFVLCLGISLGVSEFAFNKVWPFDKHYWVPVTPYSLVYISSSSLICILNLAYKPHKQGKLIKI